MILVKIKLEMRVFYIKAYMYFCAHLVRTSLNFYLSAKLFTQQLKGEMTCTFRTQ
jgi:hypothetical protein